MFHAHSSLSRPTQPAAQSHIHCRRAGLSHNLAQHLSSVRDVRGDVPNEGAPAPKGSSHASLPTPPARPYLAAAHHCMKMNMSTRIFGPPAKAQITVANCGGRGSGSAGGPRRSQAREATAYHHNDIGHRRLGSLCLEHLLELSLRSDQKAAARARGCVRGARSGGVRCW